MNNRNVLKLIFIVFKTSKNKMITISLLSIIPIVLSINEPYNFRFAFSDGITISWSTNMLYNNDPIVKYGLDKNNLHNLVKGYSTQYIDSSAHHHVSTNPLNSNLTYFFEAGDGITMSDIKTFQTLSGEYPLKIAIYGDMGIENSNKTMEQLKSRNIDMFLHIGDISYADDKGSEVGNNPYYESTYDEFLESVEKFTNNKPYMVCPGNHDVSCHSIWDFGCSESFKNFTAFNSRFKMPDNGSKNMWYSFNFGPIHFVSINTETDYPNSPINPDTLVGSPSGGGFGNQLEWLENDLKKAVENRYETPWIIVYGHRPMYSKIVFDWPINAKSRVRNAFEKLFLKYSVDIYFAGHIHAYERNYKIIDGKTDENGIYHIITGAPGCQEKVDKDDYLHHEYTAYYNYDSYGWGELVINNKNNLTWNFYTSENGQLNDTFTFLKNIE